MDRPSTMPNREAVARLASGFSGCLIAPGDPDYETARTVRNKLVDRFPALIARCHGTADVVAAVDFASEQGLDLSVRGGSHSVAGLGTNDGGIVIDLSEMRAVFVDPASKTALVQGGALWRDVDRETQLFGLATPSGLVSSVGVGGLTLQGGIGWLRRKYGASVDNLKSVEIVTADGQVRTASETQNPELFWAVRGAGSNFGVVTRFELALHPVGPIVYAALPFYAAGDGPQLLAGFQSFAEAAPDETSPMALYYRIPPMPPFPPKLWDTPALITPAVYSGDPTEGERILAPVRQFAEPIADLSGPLPYSALQSMLDAASATAPYYYGRSAYIDRLDAEVLETFLTVGSQRPSPTSMLGLWQLGGAFGRVPEHDTALANRSASFIVLIEASWHTPADRERCIAWVREAWANLRRFGSGGIYANVAGFGEEGDELVHAAYGSNHDRLVELKTRYDPGNLFHINLNIAPS